MHDACFEGPWSPVISTAIHAGHDLRPSLAARIALDDATRLREEDPYTDRLIPAASGSVVVHRSRFEVDLNRPREEAVYRTPDDAWGLTVWDEPPPDDEIEESIDGYDAFYRQLAEVLDEIAGQGPFVVLDLHSYNHRREGASCPAADPEHNPLINVGTQWLDHGRWGELTGAFIDGLRSNVVDGEPLDVRENVRFRGGNLSRWVNQRYAGRGFALALEFKKTFMDEWTGDVDDALLGQLAQAVEVGAQALHGRLAGSA